MYITATKSKKDYFTSLNEKRITENKYFWKTVKSFLLYKVQSSERIKLAEEDDPLITNEKEFAMKLNDLFSNALINLKYSNLRILILFQKT